jgi:hypothetical protein
MQEGHMFRKNDQHRQLPLFSSINSLPAKLQNRLAESWAGTFYREFFVRIDEEPYAVLYADEPSRPNVPVNVLLGLETLKSGFGWSDEEMYDHFCYDVQVRYALGYRDLSEGHFELRTMYNFRQRVARHMQETGQNLIEGTFEQVTDEQMAAFKLKSGKLRMDSTLIASNIRKTTRLQLLVEVLQRMRRMLSEADQERYAAEFAPYLKGSSGQYIYRLKREAYDEHIQRIGKLMHKLVEELPASYAQERAYQVLQRVFQEHFVMEERGLRAKAGQELSARSLQSPDDWEATYRQKGGEGHVGYVANVTETCDPDNPFQVITKIQTEPNNTDDAAMLVEALPELRERTGVQEIHTDGGYNSPAVDAAMRENQVKQTQTAIRGRKLPEEKVGLDDFAWETDDDGQPLSVTCPQGQRAAVGPGRKAQRYRAAFEVSACAACPLTTCCPTQPLKRKAEQVLRFSQAEVDLALRRQGSAAARARGQNLRTAAEATVRAIKHPFGNGKVPVRGKARVSMVLVGSAAMNNVRRIHRYLTAQKRADRPERRAEEEIRREQRQAAVSLFASLLTQVRAGLRWASLLQPASSC